MGVSYAFQETLYQEACGHLRKSARQTLYNDGNQDLLWEGEHLE